MRQSHSHLNLYRQCPSAEHSKYTLDLPEISTPEAKRGSREHKVFCEYGTHCIEEGVATDLDYLRGRVGTDEDLEIYETFANSHLFDPVVPQMFEAKLDVIIGGYEFRAIIDHLEDLGAIIAVTDYKTDHKIRPASEVEKDLQLRRYAVVTSKKFPDVARFRCRMDFVRHGVVRDVLYDADDIAAFEAQLIADIKEVENATEWPATGGVHCNWCSYSKGCPVVEAENVDVVTNEKQAVEAAGQWLALGARMNAIKAPLSEWCSKNGLVNANGMNVGHFGEHGAAYDTEELMTVLDDKDLEYSTYLNANTTKLKAAAKKDPDLAERLEAIAIDKSKSKFTSKKAVG
jgi:hypothetical protein